MGKKVFSLPLIIVVVILLLNIGCSPKPVSPDKKAEPLVIVASTSIITDVVSNIVNGKAQVFGLIARGQDPHSFEPNPRDMARIETADIIFVNGFDLEENLLKVIGNNAKGKVIEVSNGIEAIKLEDTHEHKSTENENHKIQNMNHHGEYDPHTWMSPKNVIVWVDNIINALIAADQENAEHYKNKADQYILKLKNLDMFIKDKISSIPESKRILVTDHDFFGYLAQDYNLTVLGKIIPSDTTTSEPLLKDITLLIKKMREHKLNAIFIGSTSGEKIWKLGQTIKDELGYEIRILTLLTGSLNEKGIAGDTYLDYIRYNIDQIITGLK